MNLSAPAEVLHNFPLGALTQLLAALCLAALQINEKEELTLIDFPQMVSVSHPNAQVRTPPALSLAARRGSHCPHGLGCLRECCAVRTSSALC